MTDDIDELTYLHLEISEYVFELHELQKIIKDLDNNPEHDPIYMQEAGDRYMKLCDKLRITLEAFFAEAEKVNAPKEFSYYRLYKQLVKV